MWKYLQQNEGLKLITRWNLDTVVVKAIVNNFKKLLRYFLVETEEAHENSQSPAKINYYNLTFEIWLFYGNDHKFYTHL
jgi:hypothetical protein